MPIGQLIRDLRGARGWTQSQLAERLGGSAGEAGGLPGRDQVKRWENGKVVPGRHWLGHLARVLDISFEALAAEARLDRVNRRHFLGVAALTAAHGKLAAEMASSVAGRDPLPLTEVQTTYGTDMIIASMTDKASISCLRGWMHHGDVPVLRVNAAGILAKMPGQEQASEVARVLAHDEEVRHLYTTAVTARVCAVDWTTAARIAASPTSYAHRAQFFGSRFAREALNPRDAGARWCASVMLQELSPVIGGDSA